MEKRAYEGIVVALALLSQERVGRGLISGQSCQKNESVASSKKIV